MPSASKRSVLTAPAASARCESASASAWASSLNGTVTLSPRPPLLRNSATAARKPSSGARSAPYCMRWPVWAAKAAWICGDLLWAMGLPMTAYWSMSAGSQLVGIGKGPLAGDLDDVGVDPDIRRERSVGRGQPHDVDCGAVEYVLSGRAVDVDALDRAVSTDRNGQYQGAVQAAPSPLRVVQRADALDLLAPVLGVLGETVFACAAADLHLARTLGIFVEASIDLCLQSCDGGDRVHQFRAGGHLALRSTGLGLGFRCRCGRRCSGCRLLARCRGGCGGRRRLAGPFLLGQHRGRRRCFIGGR